MNLSILKALVLGVATATAISSAGCAPVDDAESSEAELATQLSATEIHNEATYKAMSVEGGGFGQAGRLMKFFIDARDRSNKKPYFINGNYKVNGETPEYAKYHYTFAQRQLNVPEDGTE